MGLWPNYRGFGDCTTPPASQASSSCTNLLSSPSSSMPARHEACLLSMRKRPWLLRHEACLLSMRKRPRLLRHGAWGSFSRSPAWSTRPTAGCWTRLTPLMVHRNLFWQRSRAGTLHGWGLSCATIASPHHPSGNLGGWMMPWSTEKNIGGWTVSKSGYLASCQNCSWWLPTEKTGRGSLLNCPSCLR